ncbi:MAG: RimK family alpha-L-glutamate ligase [Patescibacteria group bacterium]|nr:RimK family alpha-L-glutamate ligase [Patescibacteria group bacterium]MDD5490895.1 RimK family alpha-L-glutamate ligase [Patescibacteria group bacterium]
MKIHVLTYSSPTNLSPVTKMDLELLDKAAREQGHVLEIIYAKDCQLKFTTRRPEILIKNQKPEDMEVLLVRANFLHYNLESYSAIIKQFQMAGIPVINNHLAVVRAKNKLRTMQALSKLKIPVPKTYVIVSSEYMDDVIKGIGTFPVILKTISGSHGSGVSIIESKRGLRSVVEMMISASGPTPFIIQEYVKEAKGKDIRVFIVGKRIIAAMERIATKRGEFRSNFHLGGRVRVASMSRKEKDVAFAAIKAVGLDIAGVDILRTKTGPKVLEVNANPGLEGITQATGRDIAGEIIKYAVKKARRSKVPVEDKEVKRD